MNAGLAERHKHPVDRAGSYIGISWMQVGARLKKYRPVGSTLPPVKSSRSCFLRKFSYIVFIGKAGVAMQQSKTSPRAASGAVLGKAVFRASQALGLTGTDLAAVIGVSPASVSRLNGGQYTLSGKPFELAACLVRVFRSLDAIVHGDANSMRAWMANRNAHLNAVPREEVKTAQGLVRVMNYLDAARAPI